METELAPSVAHNPNNNLQMRLNTGNPDRTVHKLEGEKNSFGTGATEEENYVLWSAVTLTV